MFETSGERFSVQLMNSARRSEKSQRDCRAQLLVDLRKGACALAVPSGSALLLVAFSGRVA